MKTIEIISQDVFDKVRSRFENLEMGDENGAVTTDPRKARFFDFDFVVEGENNLGRVSISINELGTLKIFYGKSILEDIDPISRDVWYDFLREMRQFAKRRLLRFDTRDITKSNLNKDDFQYLAAKGNKDENMNMNESIKMTGSTKTSYRMLERTKLIVKHHNPIQDESFGARGRASNIKALYVENAEGERFKYPFIHLAGAKAMQRHVANGGRPYDDKGKAIIEMSSQIAQLAEFKRHVARTDGMNQSVNEIAERAMSKLDTLKQTMEAISKQQAYESWCNSFSPMGEQIELDPATVEDYKSKFTITSFKEDLAKFFPLIHSIMQEAGEIDLEDFVNEGDECNKCHKDPCECDEEADEGIDAFEAWANSVVEGTLEPDTLMRLSELLSNPVPIGVDGTAGIEALEGIGVVNEELEKLVAAKAAIDPTMDLRDPVAEWLSKDDPEAAQELGLTSQQPAMAPTAEGEDTMVDKPVEEKEKPSMHELAQWIGAHYNRNYKEQGFESGFRKGPSELGVMAGKEFGEEYGTLVEKMVSELDDTALQRIVRNHDRRAAEADTQTTGQLSPVHGQEEAIDPKNPRDYEKPAYMRKQAGEKPLTPKDIEDKDNASPTTSKGLAKRKAELGMSEDFEAILKLAGLAK